MTEAILKLPVTTTVSTVRKKVEPPPISSKIQRKYETEKKDNAPIATEVAANVQKKSQSKRSQRYLRTPMGEFVPTKEKKTLTTLATPIPGPLDYEPKLPIEGPFFSILGKHATLKDECTGYGPGPSKYNLRQVMDTLEPGLKHSLAQKLEKEKGVMDRSPGPLAYMVTYTDIGLHAQSFSISGRTKFKESDVPAPNCYEPRVSFGIGPSLTVGSKLVQLGAEELHPGPSDYKVNFPNYKREPSYTFRARVGVPLFHDKEDVLRPGPDIYLPIPDESKVAASLKGRYKESKALKTPGPANYVISSTIPGGPQYSMTGRMVPYEDEPYYIPAPGPTEYTPKSISLDHAPAFSLAARIPEPKDPMRDTPAAVDYEPKQYVLKNNSNPKPSLKPRRYFKQETFPGPADYNIRWEFGSKYAKYTNTNIPPGKIAKSQGEPVKEVQSTPGPADYDVPKSMQYKSCTPRVSFGVKPATGRKQKTPGPDAYYPKQSFDAPGTSLKGRPSPFVMVFPTNRLDSLKVK